MRFALAGLKLASRTLRVRPAEGGFGYPCALALGSCPVRLLGLGHGFRVVSCGS